MCRQMFSNTIMMFLNIEYFSKLWFFVRKFQIYLMRNNIRIMLFDSCYVRLTFWYLVSRTWYLIYETWYLRIFILTWSNTCFKDMHLARKSLPLQLFFCDCMCIIKCKFAQWPRSKQHPNEFLFLSGVN